MCLFLLLSEFFQLFSAPLSPVLPEITGDHIRECTPTDKASSWVRFPPVERFLQTFRDHPRPTRKDAEG